MIGTPRPTGEVVLNLRERTFELLRLNPGQRFKAREIAEWIHSTYPEETLDKLEQAYFLKPKQPFLVSW